jgi:hypothetical protein
VYPPHARFLEQSLPLQARSSASLLSYVPTSALFFSTTSAVRTVFSLSRKISISISSNQSFSEANGAVPRLDLDARLCASHRCRLGGYGQGVWLWGHACGRRRPGGDGVRPTSTTPERWRLVACSCSGQENTQARRCRSPLHEPVICTYSVHFKEVVLRLV